MLRKSEEGDEGRVSGRYPTWAVGEASDDGFEEESTLISTRLQAKAGGSDEGVGPMDGHFGD